jgi:hypothetical protein
MSSILKCPICQEDLIPSHPYKKHKIKLEDFMHKYYPKNDLLTGEKIEWKGDIGNYLLSDFINKINLKKWLKLQDKTTCQNYLKHLLINRMDLKGWIYEPTQVELRSCPEMVGIKTFSDYFEEGYDKLCSNIGYKTRGFTDINVNIGLKEIRDLKGNPILVDSREQEMINFGNKEINICALPVGDYSIKKDNYNIFIERKSLNDLISTFGPKNFDRFRRELIKAQEIGAYIILLVENDINTALGFDHSPFYSKHTQMTATFLFHQVRILLQEFPNWQIAFCKNRTDMKEWILRIFKTGVFWKTHDIQLAIDLKLF